MTVVVSGCVAGNIGCWMQDGQALVGYWIDKEHWGKGVATEMLAPFMQLVADRPLHAYVVRHNFVSIRVLEKCGFVNCTNSKGVIGEPSDGLEELLYVLDKTSYNPGSTSDT